MATPRELRTTAAKAAARLRAAQDDLDEADTKAERAAAQARIDAAQAAVDEANEALRSSTGESVDDQGTITTGNELIDTGTVRLDLTPSQAARAALQDKGVATDDLSDAHAVTQAKAAAAAERVQVRRDAIRASIGKDPDSLSPTQQDAALDAEALDQLGQTDITRTRPVGGISSAADSLRRAALLDDPDEAEEAIAEARQDARDDTREQATREIIAAHLGKDAADLTPADFATFQRDVDRGNVEAVTGKPFESLNALEIAQARQKIRDADVEARRRAGQGDTGDQNQDDRNGGTVPGNGSNDTTGGNDDVPDVVPGRGGQGQSDPDQPPAPVPDQGGPAPAQPGPPPPDDTTPPPLSPGPGPDPGPGPAPAPDDADPDSAGDAIPPIFHGRGTVEGGEHNGEQADVFEDPGTGTLFGVLDDGTVISLGGATDQGGEPVKTTPLGGETVVTAPGNQSDPPPPPDQPPPAGEDDDSDDDDADDDDADDDDEDAEDDGDDGAEDEDDAESDDGSSDDTTDNEDQAGTSTDPDDENANRGRFVSLIDDFREVVESKNPVTGRRTTAGTPTPDDDGGELAPGVSQLIGGGLLTDRVRVTPGVGNPGAPGGLREGGIGGPLDAVTGINDPGAIDPRPDADQTPQGAGRELDPFGDQQPSPGFPDRPPETSDDDQDDDASPSGLAAAVRGGLTGIAGRPVSGLTSLRGRFAVTGDDDDVDEFGAGTRPVQSTVARPAAPPTPPVADGDGEESAPTADAVEPPADPAEPTPVAEPAADPVDTSEDPQPDESGSTDGDAVEP